MTFGPRFFPSRGRSPEGKWVLALGNFDGVHLGHRSLIDAALRLSKAGGFKAGAVTFDPNPKEVLAPDKPFARIYSAAECFGRLLRRGLDGVFVLPFDRAFSELSPEIFADEGLARSFGAVKIVVGENFRFGRNRAGDAAFLEKRLRDSGVELETVPSVMMDGQPVSSSSIRRKLLDADFDGAQALLGNVWSISGTVAKGEGRGATLGVPTANLPLNFLPPLRLGVYGVRVRFNGRSMAGVMNLGVRPTFGELPAPRAEIHVFDFEGDLYRREFEAVPLFLLRPERTFVSADELKRQIMEDIRNARSRFEHADSR